MEEKILAKVKSIKQCKKPDCLGCNFYANSIIDLFQETIEQAMPEKDTNTHLWLAHGYNQAIDDVKSNLLKAFASER